MAKKVNLCPAGLDRCPIRDMVCDAIERANDRVSNIWISDEPPTTGSERAIKSLATSMVDVLDSLHELRSKIC